jgi:integrase
MMPTTGNKKRTPATVNRYMATLSAVLNYGVKECEWLTINPVSKLKKFKEPRGRDRILSPGDLERFLEVCAKSSNPYLLPFVAIGISTGACKMEILNLTWSSVDLITGLIELKETKNDTLRTICLVGLALDLVKELYEKRNVHNPYLFPAKRRFGTLSIRKAWDSALKDAGISDYHVHDLRHQFCTTTLT